MEFGLKWFHMARYGVILRLDGALWLTIISKPPLTPRRAIKNPSPLLTGYPWNRKLDIFRSRSICESCRKSGTKFLKIFCTHIRRSDSKLLDFQVHRYLKSGLGRAGLEVSGNLEIQKSKILKSLTQGFGQVQNSDIFDARVRASPKI